ncbi:ATP-binding protein [Halobellus sp. H-GB7]|uniref:sensor histidine kinase n=1 Tax=Halobellus sp. H-GB7 TaxID=3069756 RepID=UPI0027B15017|nr:ATP-binding protein [Halobellus sp. H-GB7]MDQ2055618.1 histidine kinase N-terminal 7TM domain-containing protein [Halobellus sp. H-GB7]
MNLLFLGHVLAFVLAALGCFVSLKRVQAIAHDGTRRGLTVFLLTSGLWAGANLGYLVAASPLAKRAFYVFGLVVGLIAVAAWLSFCAAYTGRSPRQLPYARLVSGIILVLIAVKLTNPLHHLYFTAAMVATPFPHLEIQHGIMHWTVLGLAYALSFVGFYMLLEHFHYAGTDTRPLAVLVMLTALPVGANIIGVTSPWLLAITYEPIGVATFALGVVFVYFDRFQRAHRAGEIDDAVLFLDQDNQIRDYNQTACDLFPQLSGTTGKSLETVLPMIDGNETPPETVTLTRDGDTKYYRIASAPFIAGNSETGRSIVISDVSEAEQYRRDLERKTEQLEVLNRIVRHDIRNDMTVIRGWAETLEGRVDDEGRDALERVLRAADHTMKLTKDARDYIEAIAGEQQPELKSVTLRSHLKAEVDTAQESHPDAEIQISGNIPAVGVCATEMLPSVFRNLLSNAVQHNDKATAKITVRVEERDESAVVQIADNGPGIPDKQKEAIFGKGEKGLESEGSGIGLYLVQTLVEQFNGAVRVEDNDPEGAVFTIELQKAEERPTETEPSQRNPAL